MTDEQNIRGYSALAYNPRSRDVCTGHTHIVVTSAISGRLSRDPHDALCRKNFWGLYARDEPATCPRCLAIAVRYGVEVVSHDDAIGNEAQS